MTLTDAQEKDTGFLAEAEKLCFPGREWKKSDIEYLVKQDYSYCRICESGYLIGRILGGEAELLRIGVLPAHRGKGTGRRLLTDFLTACIKKKVERVFLEVRESNTVARSLYESTGFVCRSTRRNYYGNEDAMIYDLNTGEIEGYIPHDDRW